jgi:hypothetical protein
MTEDEDDRPWEQPGAQRRDWESHRVGLLYALAGPCAMGLGPTAMLVWMEYVGPHVVLAGAGFFACSLGLALAVIAHWMTGRDLEKMRMNFMDPEGRHDTEFLKVVTTFCAPLYLVGGSFSVVLGIIKHML